MSCANHGFPRTRLLQARRPQISLNKRQIRNKNDAFPIPPSFQLSKAARAGRQHQGLLVRKPKSSRSSGPLSIALKGPLKEASRARPASLTASNFKLARAPEYLTGPTFITGLDNEVETYIDAKGPRRFGLHCEDLVREHSQASLRDLYDFMPAFIKRDTLNSGPLKLFWTAINGLLPRDPLNPDTLVTPKGGMHHLSYSKKSPEDGYESNKLNLHSHLITFNHPIAPKHLLLDGTDTRFLPGPGDIWQYRLWAGGSITLNGALHRNYDEGGKYHMVERPTAMRVVGQERAERVFVTIRKSFHRLQNFLQKSKYTKEKILDVLDSEPLFYPTPKDGNTLPTFKGGPVFEEEYTLCFLREPPNLSRSTTKVVRPPGEPKFSHTLTPNRHLLFCWSAMTYNAHLIHYDTAFARTQYGAHDLVVHGPLTLYLMIEWVNRQLTIYAKNTQMNTFQLRSITYKNLLPLYVDQEMKLCMKPSEFPQPGELARKWAVWIEKDLGEGLWTTAFKGEIVVERLAAPQSDKRATNYNGAVLPGSWAERRVELDRRANRKRPPLPSQYRQGRRSGENPDKKPEERSAEESKERPEESHFESPFFP